MRCRDETAAANEAWSRAVVDELVRAGVRHACISPGSRSAPLTLALADRVDVTISAHVDERSGAYFALGYARATGVPTVIVCTSGTAAANLYPAIVEAHHSRVPLVALTADRPPEMRDTGDWQAIDQVKLYGGFARWFCELALPSLRADMLRYARAVASRAVAVALGPPAGPVHLNMPFREPLTTHAISVAGDERIAKDLTPQGDEYPRDTARGRRVAAPAGMGQLSTAGRPDGSTWAAVHRAQAQAAPGAVAALADLIVREPRGLILAGQTRATAGYPEALALLAAACRYPILAEPTGGLRYGPHDRSHVITGYDAVLRSEEWRSRHPPGMVLRFGRSFAWKHTTRYLEEQPEAVQVVVDRDSCWDDPTRLAAQWFVAEPEALCRALAAQVTAARAARAGSAAEGARSPVDLVRDAGRAESPGRDRPASGWLTDWRRADEAATAVVRRHAAMADAGTVGWVYPLLLERLPEAAVLYAANSMAVRDLDTYTGPSDRRLQAIANRGASGIDGTVSSALGAAFGTGRPTVLVTGDLAFAHDVNGLAAQRLDGLAATIVVLNDGGGGIFAHLPIAGADPDVFERFFRMPAGVDLALVCAAYGVRHSIAADPATLDRALVESLTAPGVKTIEVPLDLAANTAAHRRLWDAVSAALH